MAKKSKAQITRLMKRAEARGEVYEPPVEAAGTRGESKAEKEIEDKSTEIASNSDTKEPLESKPDEKKIEAAKDLRKELEAIEANEGLRSKERRSAKRKAEAIAAEATGMQSDELLAWLHDHEQRNEPKRKKANPYIVFVGQLAYDTTKESLFRHIQENIGNECNISPNTVQIRMLTDPEKKTSRGAAFVETTDPELLYSFLKLHHTVLDGRRINVERSAGGRKNSAARKAKLEKYRTQQEDFLQASMKKVINEYIERGEIQEGELDDVALSVSQRHSMAVVNASLEEYVESNGGEKENPSSYFTFLLGKFASEGWEGGTTERKKRA